MTDTDPVTLTVEQVRAVLDLITGTLDYGSGFLCDEDVVLVRSVAAAIGVDPNNVTPYNYVCKYNNDAKPHRLTTRSYGNLGGPGGERWCTICGDTEGAVRARGERCIFVGNGS